MNCYHSSLCRFIGYGSATSDASGHLPTMCARRCVLRYDPWSPAEQLTKSDRRLAGLAPSEVARVLRVDRSRVTRWLAGRTDPKNKARLDDWTSSPGCFSAPARNGAEMVERTNAHLGNSAST